MALPRASSSYRTGTVRAAVAHRGGQDAPVKSPDDGVLAGTDAQLSVDGLGVGLHRVRRQAELGGNLGEGHRPAQQAEHRYLALGDVVWQSCGLTSGHQARTTPGRRHPLGGWSRPAGSGSASLSGLSLIATSGHIRLARPRNFNTY